MAKGTLKIEKKMLTFQKKRQKDARPDETEERGKENKR